MIDIVVHDPKTDITILCMIEERGWGDTGVLIPDLQKKFGTYLTYSLDGQLREDYPALMGKPIRIELKKECPPTQREQQFFDFVTRKYLEPETIAFGWKLLTGG